MDYTSLSPRARLLFYLQALARLVLFWLPASVAAGGALTFVLPVSWSAVIALSVLFLAFVGAVWLPWLAFERWGYAVTDVELLIRSGVIVRRVTAIPLGRVQHVDVRQGPIEQALGLRRVQIHTASGASVDGVIPGLEVDAAEQLRELLVRRATGDDGV